jgi:hypothetical protein
MLLCVVALSRKSGMVEMYGFIDDAQIARVLWSGADKQLRDREREIAIQ